MFSADEGFEGLKNQTYAGGPVDETIVGPPILCRLVLDLGIQHCPVAFYLNVLDGKPPLKLVERANFKQALKHSITKTGHVCPNGFSVGRSCAGPLLQHLVPLIF